MTTEITENKKAAPLLLVRVPKLSKGWHKHIRLEKARIRRDATTPDEAKEQVRELYARFLPRPH